MPMQKARTQTPTAAGGQKGPRSADGRSSLARRAAGAQGLTGEELLADFRRVDERSENPLDGAEHTAQAQVHQHEEEHDGPEGGGWEMRHGLREGDEGQACALDHLERRRTFTFRD